MTIEDVTITALFSQRRRPHGSRPFHDLTGIVPENP